MLCLGAHSDDIEIGCGGTVLQLLDARPDLEVDWVVLTAPGERADEASASAERFLTGAGETGCASRAFGSAISPISQRLGVVRRPGRDRSRPGVVPVARRRPPGPSHRSELVGNTSRNQLVLEYEIPKFDGDLGRPLCTSISRNGMPRRSWRGSLRDFPARSGREWFTDETFRALLRLRGDREPRPSGLAEAFHCSKLVPADSAATDRAAEVVTADLAVMGDDLEAVFSAMSGQRLLITGGAGFLGYYWSKRRLAWNAANPDRAPISVTVFDNYFRGVPGWLGELEGRDGLDLRNHDMRLPLPEDMG